MDPETVPDPTVPDPTVPDPNEVGYRCAARLRTSGDCLRAWRFVGSEYEIARGPAGAV